MSDATSNAGEPTGTSDVLEVLTELMRTATRPEVMEAQRVLLQRLAYQGDVFDSRIPAPLNITEVGGYLNLLASAGFNDTRASAIASALGIAGPPPSSVVIGGALPVGFVEFPNDRPSGPVESSIPPLITVRADFASALHAAKAALHASGCALPLRSVAPRLPPAGPVPDADLDQAVVLASLGRTLAVYPGTVLVDPASDPLAIARPDATPAEPARLVARQLDGSGTVAEQEWVAMTANATEATEGATTAFRFVEVAPIMQAQGWYHPQPEQLPQNLKERGTLVEFVNLTGLVAAETTLMDELTLLYSAAEIARSSLWLHAHLVWDGARFAEP